MTDQELKTELAKLAGEPPEPLTRDFVIAAVLTRTETEQTSIADWLYFHWRTKAYGTKSSIAFLLTAPPTLICSAFVAVCGKEGR